MTINGDDLLNSILKSIDRIDHIRPEDIPNIDLYMDQVTTFMDGRLRATARCPGNDKILTKTMINNYAKNDLLPPPVKKKYSREHVLVLIFIYYFKGFLSMDDIQSLLRPITDKFFHKSGKLNLEDIYREIFALEPDTLEDMKDDVRKKYERAEGTFKGAPNEEILKKFAFICELGLDVYVKKLMIEKMLDECYEKSAAKSK